VVLLPENRVNRTRGETHHPRGMRPRLERFVVF